jgi:DNA (cytosine-5)-methyltransferase 1
VVRVARASGLGATSVPGVELVMAANHSPRAIETHAANFPSCEHDCADISQVEPRRYRPTDLLWASPECTNHSIAQGRRKTYGPDENGETLSADVAVRSRSTMWDVPRFAEVHSYSAVIVENVTDVTKWPPFPSWLGAMDSLDYDYQIVSLNSMFAPAINAPRAPQSRDRAYVVFTKKGNPAPDLDVTPAARCSSCDAEVAAVQTWKPGRTVGRYRSQYTYTCPSCQTVVEPYTEAAGSVIDWDLPAQRIGDRAKPLSEKTLNRIRIGLEKFVIPQLVPAGGSWNEGTTPVTVPFRTRTTRESEGLLVPVEGRDGKEAFPTWRPMRTQTARAETGLAFIAELRGGHSTARSVHDPLATVCANGNHHGLTVPTNPPTVESCFFRMLAVAEIQSAMAFTKDYVVTGTKRERVRQLGNGVTPPAAEFLVGAVVNSLN